MKFGNKPEKPSKAVKRDGNKKKPTCSNGSARLRSSVWLRFMSNSSHLDRMRRRWSRSRTFMASFSSLSRFFFSLSSASSRT